MSEKQHFRYLTALLCAEIKFKGNAIRIIRELELRKPVFAATAAYGHFGRPDTDFLWERTNKVSALKKALIAPVKAK